MGGLPRNWDRSNSDRPHTGVAIGDLGAGCAA